MIQMIRQKPGQEEIPLLVTSSDQKIEASKTCIEFSNKLSRKRGIEFSEILTVIKNK